MGRKHSATVTLLSRTWRCATSALSNDILASALVRRIWRWRARRLSAIALNEGNNDKAWRNAARGLLASRDNKGFASRSRNFYFEDSEREAIRGALYDLVPACAERIIANAKVLCSRQYHFLGITYDAPAGPDWHRDPVSGTHWPFLFCEDIPHTGPTSLGDVKLPWELARHQFLVTLAEAFFLTGDELFAREAISVMNSWIDENPPYVGVHWISSLEVAMRLMSWIWVLHLLRNSSHLDLQVADRLLTATAVQAAYVETHLSIGQFGNNHLIGEAAGLAMVGMYFHELPAAQRWSRRGLGILEVETIRQILPDGGGVEQAFGYLRFILEFLLSAFLLARANGINVRPTSTQRVARGIEFLSHVLLPDGTVPRVGDADDGRALVVHGNNYWDFRGLLALGAGIFARPDFKTMARNPSEELIWIGGTRGVATYARLYECPAVRLATHFTRSGYTIVRHGHDADALMLMIDWGPLGSRNAAHGHADCLGIQLFCNGRYVLVDPGTFTYNQDAAFREYFRSTQAHNTVVVDNMSQADTSGRMAWRHSFSGIAELFYSDDAIAYVATRHPGYRRLPSPVDHSRVLVASRDPAYFLVIDRLESPRKHHYDLNYHFAPDATVLQAGAYLQVILDGKDALRVAFSASENKHVHLHRGQHDPIQGWYSNNYGSREPCVTATCSCDGLGLVEFRSLLFPVLHNAPPSPVRLEPMACHGATCLRVTYGGTEDLWFISDGDCICETEKVSYTGRALRLRRHGDEEFSSIRGVECSVVKLGNALIVNSPRPLSGQFPVVVRK